ncbi:MAG: hypothetical protein ABIP29_05610, partial [Candidatus Eisenbacteria bacterium]
MSAQSPVDVTLRSIARLGIRSRLMLALPAFVLLVVAVGTIFHLTAVADITLGTMVTSAELIARQIIEQVDGATKNAPAQRALATTLQHDQALAGLFKSSVGYYPFIHSVGITDVNGRVLAHSTESLVGDTLGTPVDAAMLTRLDRVARLRALYGSRDFEVVRPMQRGDRTIGVVRVGMSNTLVREALGRTLQTSLWFAAFALTIALVLAVVLADLITEPLRKLTAGIERVGQGGWGQQIESVEAEDLSQLVSSFNLMSQRVAEDRSELEERSRRLAVLVDGLEDGILMADAGGLITLANPTA